MMLGVKLLKADFRVFFQMGLDWPKFCGITLLPSHLNTWGCGVRSLHFG